MAVDNIARGLAASALKKGGVTPEQLEEGLTKKLDKVGGTVTGDLAVQGDLTVAGTTKFEKTETLMVEDNVIATNANKVALQALLSGLAINKDANATYGVMYDPADDTVKFGQGVLDKNGKFTFNEGEGRPLAIRAQSGDLTENHLIKWDSTTNSFVDSGRTVTDIEGMIATEVGKGVSSVQQPADPKYKGVVKAATKNPYAKVLYPELTDTEPLGAVGDYAASFGGNSSVQAKRGIGGGTSSVTKGAYSQSLGDNTVTTPKGTDSTAIGYQTTTDAPAAFTHGSYSVVMSQKYVEGMFDPSVEPGQGGSGQPTEPGTTPADTLEMDSRRGEAASAGGFNSYSSGFAAEVDGVSNVADGHISKASGRSNRAWSYLSKVDGKNSVVRPDKLDSSATGEGSWANGKDILIQGAEYAYSGGSGNEVFTGADNSFSYGEGLEVHGQNQTVVGKYNKNDKNSLFEVGNGSDKNNRETVFKISNPFANTHDTPANYRAYYKDKEIATLIDVNNLDSKLSENIKAHDTDITNLWTVVRSTNSDLNGVNASKINYTDIGQGLTVDENKKVKANITKIQDADSTEFTPDENGVVTIPDSANNVKGLITIANAHNAYNGLEYWSGGRISIHAATKNIIDSRLGLDGNGAALQPYQPIIPSSINYAVKAALTDDHRMGTETSGTNTAFTDTEKDRACEILGAARTTTSEMVGGNLLQWDATANKIVDAGKATSSFLTLKEPAGVQTDFVQIVKTTDGKVYQQSAIGVATVNESNKSILAPVLRGTSGQLTCFTAPEEAQTDRDCVNRGELNTKLGDYIKKDINASKFMVYCQRPSNTSVDPGGIQMIEYSSSNLKNTLAFRGDNGVLKTETAATDGQTDYDCINRKEFNAKAVDLTSAQIITGPKMFNIPASSVDPGITVKLNEDSPDPGIKVMSSVYDDKVEINALGMKVFGEGSETYTEYTDTSITRLEAGVIKGVYSFPDKSGTLALADDISYYHHYIYLTVDTDKYIYYDFPSTQQTAYTAATLPAQPDVSATTYTLLYNGRYASISGQIYRNASNELKAILHGIYTTDGTNFAYLELNGVDVTFNSDTVQKIN